MPVDAILATLQYFLVIVASTLPVPAGIFMPSFVIGAAMGRFIGELVALFYPNGFRNNQQLLILPGIYSVVGTSIFCKFYFKILGIFSDLAGVSL